MTAINAIVLHVKERSSDNKMCSFYRLDQDKDPKGSIPEAGEKSEGYEPFGHIRQHVPPPVLEYRLQTDGSILQNRGVCNDEAYTGPFLTHVAHGPIKIVLLTGYSWMPLTLCSQRSDVQYCATSSVYYST